MTPFERDLVGFVAGFKWRPMSWQRRVMLDMRRRRDAELRGEAWALARDLTARERHCLYRLAWKKMQEVHSPLAIPVKEWLAANAQPPSRAAERRVAAAAKADAARRKMEAAAALAPKLL